MYLSFESIHAFNLWPFEIIQDPRAMKQHMTAILKQSSRPITLRLLEFNQPFTTVLLPVASDDFGAEVHVFPQSPDLTDFVEVFPDVGGVGEEARPFRLDVVSDCEMELFGRDCLR
jgi:hypothetical protein